MIFHSWKQLYSTFTHELWSLFALFRTSTFLTLPSSYLLQRFLCLILRIVFFHQKEVWMVSTALIGFVGNGAIRAWRNIFQISKPLETIIRPLRVMFQNHPGFNTICRSETILRKLHFSFIPLLHKKLVPQILIASLQRYCTSYHRLPLELVSGLLFPLFHISSNLVLFQLGFQRILYHSKKLCIICLCSIKEVALKYLYIFYFGMFFNGKT